MWDSGALIVPAMIARLFSLLYRRDYTCVRSITEILSQPSFRRGETDVTNLSEVTQLLGPEPVLELLARDLKADHLVLCDTSEEHGEHGLFIPQGL